MDVFETYECSDCGSNWEWVILTENKHPVLYRWRLNPKTNRAGLPIGTAEAIALTSRGEHRAMATVMHGDPVNPLSWNKLL